MTDRLSIGDPPISILLRRRANARRLTLRMTREGAVMTIPRGAAISEARQFAAKQEAWLRRTMSAIPDNVVVGPGAVIPFMGEPMEIVAGDGRGCRIIDFSIAVGGRPEAAGARVRAWLKEEARNRLLTACDSYAAQVGRSFGRVSLRDTKSRWGSCTTDGNLMFSWRLIMAPAEVLDYVAAHEVAHLREMNHSARFWAIVTDICPDWKSHRDWLRHNGAGLHRFRFEA